MQVQCRTPGKDGHLPTESRMRGASAFHRSCLRLDFFSSTWQTRDASGWETRPAAPLGPAPPARAMHRCPKAALRKRGDFPHQESSCHQVFEPFDVKPSNARAADVSTAGCRCGWFRPSNSAAIPATTRATLDFNVPLSTSSLAVLGASIAPRTSWPPAHTATPRGTGERGHRRRRCTGMKSCVGSSAVRGTSSGCSSEVSSRPRLIRGARRRFLVRAPKVVSDERIVVVVKANWVSLRT